MKNSEIVKNHNEHCEKFLIHRKSQQIESFSKNSEIVKITNEPPS